MCFVPSNSLCMNEYTDHLILPKHQPKIYRHILGFLFVCVCVCVCVLTQSCPALCNPMDQPTRFLCPWNFPGENFGMNCHFLLQGIFSTQRSNPHPLLWQEDSLPLRHFRAYFSGNDSPNFSIFVFLQSGQAKDFLNHQILVSFCLTILLLIYLFLFSFYYNQQEEIMFHLQRFAVLDS